MTVRISAPGKLVVAGEYAVLDGATAVVTAVDRRATLDFDRAEPAALGTDVPAGAVCRLAGMDSAWWLTGAPGAYALVDQAGAPAAGDAAALFAAFVRVVSARGLSLPAGRVHVDSSALHAGHGGAKLGLGSSAAAAAVLATWALTNGGAGLTSTDDVFDLAYAVHHDFSGGRGSGIDVAAASTGGFMAFKKPREGDAAPAGRKSGPVTPRVTPLGKLPAGVTVLCAYAGHAQSTRAFVGAVQDLAARDPEGHAACLGAIEAAADALRACIGEDAHGAKAGSAADLFRAVHAHRQAMDALGRAAGIDIVSTPHAAIARLAEKHGGAAKPSGAGGGDVALCFVPTAQARGLLADLVGAGLFPVPLRLGAKGPRVHEPGEG